MPEQLIIGFNPMTATYRVAYRGSQIRGRILWVIVAAVFCTWIMLWMGKSMTIERIVMMYGIALSISLIWLLIAIVSWFGAKSALAAIPPGVAMTVDRGGMWVNGTGMAWPEIERISITSGRFGKSPSLSVNRIDGQAFALALANLDVMPGTIDDAVRAYSSGTQAIDTRKFGN